MPFSIFLQSAGGRSFPALKGVFPAVRVVKSQGFWAFVPLAQALLNHMHHRSQSVALFMMLCFAAAASFPQPATPIVTKRQMIQQARTKEGVKSSELMKKEAVRLEAQQKKIVKDKQEEKADGVVTPAERPKLHHEQNKVSRKIYHQKHDGQKR